MHIQIILVLLLSIFLACILAGWLFKLAIERVVEVFRAQGVLSRTSAKTARELNLEPEGFLTFRIGRDYRPQALGFLIRKGIVIQTEEDKLYLVEANLARLEGR